MRFCRDPYWVGGCFEMTRNSRYLQRLSSGTLNDLISSISDN